MRSVGPLTIALMCLVLVTLLVAQADRVYQKDVENLQAQIQDLQDRWYGAPAVYRPPAIANTTVVFFDVTGTTQRELVKSLDGADICAKYPPCAVDPANPSGSAWGLEGDKQSAAADCYTPQTAAVPFTHLVVLPRWSPPADGTIRISLVMRWNDLAKAIYVHESGHVAVADKDLADLNSQAQQQPTCEAWLAFWQSPHVFDKLEADQAAYHARLRADCRPAVGCIPAGWEGW